MVPKLIDDGLQVVMDDEDDPWWLSSWGRRSTWLFGPLELDDENADHIEEANPTMTEDGGCVSGCCSNGSDYNAVDHPHD